MSTWIAFVRGIGGGIRPLPMKDFKTALEQEGFKNVRTYIQSGNVVFASARATNAKLSKRISDCVAENFGFQPQVMTLGLAELEHAAANNPFRKAEAEPKSLHLFFMAEPPPAAKLEEMVKWQAPGDEFTLKGNVFYFHTPQGFSNSKLSERVERLLGVPATARNWRTVTTVLKLAQQK